MDPSMTFPLDPHGLLLEARVEGYGALVLAGAAAPCRGCPPPQSSCEDRQQASAAAPEWRPGFQPVPTTRWDSHPQASECKPLWAATSYGSVDLDWATPSGLSTAPVFQVLGQYV